MLATKNWKEQHSTNLGLVFDERGDYKHSLEQYQRALEIHRASHFERGEGDTLGNIGGIYLPLGIDHVNGLLPFVQSCEYQLFARTQNPMLTRGERAVKPPLASECNARLFGRF
jgi:hypothetical protein